LAVLCDGVTSKDGTEKADSVAVKIGIAGYQGAGKSTLFEWLTGIPADPALSHKTQMATAVAPDDRVGPLCEVYKPKKITQASLEIVDTPGLSRGHDGNENRLAAIREAGCLVMVSPAFSGADPWEDLAAFEEDLLLTDLDLVSKRVERLEAAVKKPTKNREEQQIELEALRPIEQTLGEGKPLRGMEMTPQQSAAIRSFQLFTEKPRFVIINTAEDEENPQRFLDNTPEGVQAAAVSLSLQLELAGMEPAERDEFCSEMGVEVQGRDDILRQMMHVSGQMLFFTAGEKEVRTWMIRQGGTAVEAAGAIHTDLARGFIRASTMTIDDLVRLGSEREVKAANLVRQEPKDYVIQDGDILEIRHN